MDEEEEQLDYEEDGDEEQLLGDDEDEQNFDGEEEAGYEDPDAPQDHQEAEDDELAGLGEDADEDTMQENTAASNGHAEEEHNQGQQSQQQQDEHANKQDQDGQDGKAPKRRVIKLDVPSNRLALVKSPKGQQQQPQQGRAPISKPTPSSSLRGPLRYFMLRSVNTDNWDIAQQQGVWGTQPHNEAKFNEAFRKGCEVVFFLSAGKAATCIHGYGRMCSLSGQAPMAPWLDIDRAKVNNFHVSWDCTTPINYKAVEHLKNPWCDPRQGALSKGEPRPLKRHADGHELAPQVGEQLLEAMNSNAAKAGKPATGPLAQGIRRGAGAAAARPGWPQQQQQHPGMGPQQQQQMHMQQRMMMQQQQQQRGGGMAGRGMMGGPHAGMGMGPGPMGPTRGPLAGRLQQQQPPPPMGGRMQPVGGSRPHAGPLASDPRLNPRFAGRLRLDPGDDFPPGGGAPYRSRSSPPPYDHRSDSRDERERHRGDGRDRRYEGDHEWDRERDERHRQGHGSRSRRHSRSRSRSPPRAASSRGGSTGRLGGAGVVESSFGSPDGRRQQQQQLDEEESVKDMTYDEYLATWEKVQARIKRLEATQEQQLQLALVPQQQQQQQMPNGAMGMRGAGMPGGVRGAVMGGDVGPGMLARGGSVPGFPSPPGGVLRAGVVAAGVGVDGAVGPGRPAGNPTIPTLAEYMQRIKARLVERGQPIPPDSVIAAKYQEKMSAQLQQGGQQQQQQRMQPAPPQQQLAMGQGMGPASGMMGMGQGMDPMNMAMNPMNMMAAMAATNMMGMMGQAMMGPGGGPGGMGVGQGGMPGALGPLQMQQQGMGGAGGQMMGRGGGRQGPGGRGGRGQMMPMQQQMGGGF